MKYERVLSENRDNNCANEFCYTYLIFKNKERDEETGVKNRKINSKRNGQKDRERNRE